MKCDLSEMLWALTRTKHIDEGKMTESKLKRVLTTFDITALGVGATLGKYIFFRRLAVS